MIINTENGFLTIRGKYLLFLFVLSAFFITPGFIPAYAAASSLQGKIIDGSTQKPVNFAIMIIQEAGLVVNAPQGNYYIELPAGGTYNVKIQSPGLETLNVSVKVEGNVARDFTLNPYKSKRGGVVIKGEKDIQKISRQTMSNKEIKEVPASFGDSLNALTALPGVSRPDGIFGPLVIRGADSAYNGYFIDDIPIYNPMHFGGLHSVINNDLMKDIDLYESSFPSQFGNAQAAIININTIDEVNEEGGSVDVGLVSSCVLVKTPITETVIINGKEKKENKGYIIASGRLGYLSLFIPMFYEYVLNDKFDQSFEYWDYQFKAKYYLNSSNSVTLLSFGSGDRLNLILKDDYLEDGDDPYWTNAAWKQNQQSHNVGLYYTFKPGESFSNTLMVYGAMTDYYMWEELPEATATWAKDVGITSKPYIFGLKDKVKTEWWKSHGELRAGVEFNYYRFMVNGCALMPGEGYDYIDPGDEEMGVKVPVNDTIINRTIFHYIENRFTFGWVTLIPGYHAEYLALMKKWTFDPRGSVSIAFPTGTTLGAAGGYYSCFLQINPTYFNNYPNLAKDDSLDPAKSVHRALSLEQKVSDYTFKAEGYYNNYWDLVNAENGVFYNASKVKTYGVELMAKISDNREQGLFGWVSYTLSKSRCISNLTTDKYGDQWVNSWCDQPHVVKFVTGYTYKSHTLSAKFQFNSSFPYTPITGNDPGTEVEGYGDGYRYSPVYGKTCSGRLGPSYQLDLRYTRKTGYRWGNIIWYIEVINATNYQSDEYYWDYRYVYSENNPRVKKASGFAVIPNFGVEVKF